MPANGRRDLIRRLKFNKWIKTQKRMSCLKIINFFLVTSFLLYSLEPLFKVNFLWGGHQIRYEEDYELLVVHKCIQNLQSSLLIFKS